MSQLPTNVLPGEQTVSMPYATVTNVEAGLFRVDRFRADGQRGMSTYHGSWLFAQRVARRWTIWARKRFLARLAG